MLAYEMKDAALTQIKVDWDVPAWFIDGDGDHSLAEQVEFCRSHLDQGGVLLGAFQGDLPVGAAIVRPRLREGMAQLAFLYVSRKFRRLGIARRLMEEACAVARQVRVAVNKALDMILVMITALDTNRLGTSVHWSKV